MRERIINFPDCYSLGNLYIADQRNLPRRRLEQYDLAVAYTPVGEARGARRILVPDDGMLMLDIADDNAALKHISNLNPDSVDVVTGIDSNYKLQAVAENFPQVRGLIIRQWWSYGSQSLAPIMSSFKNLQHFVIEDADKFNYIGQMESLKTLVIHTQQNCAAWTANLLKVLLGLDKLENFEYAANGQCKLSCEEVEILQRLSSLRKLCLQSFKFEDDVLEKIGFCKRLESLELRFTTASDSGLAHIANLTQLKSLRVSGIHNPTGEGLRFLGSLSNLEELSVDNFEDKFAHVLESMQALRTLELKGSLTAAGRPATDYILDSIGKLSKLNSLHLLSLMPAITERGITHLQELSLTDLKLERTKVDDEVIKVIARISTLKSLELIDVSGLRDDHLTAIQDLKLETLGLMRQNYKGGVFEITDTGIESIAKMISLKHLALVDTQVSNDGLKHLTSLKQLASLSLDLTNVTAQGVRHLLPLRELRYLSLRMCRVMELDIVPVLLHFENLRKVHIGYIPALLGQRELGAYLSGLAQWS